MDQAWADQAVSLARQMTNVYINTRQAVDAGEINTEEALKKRTAAYKTFVAHIQKAVD